MMGKTTRTVFLALAILTISMTLAPTARAQTALRKAGRGLAAMTTGFLEVPGNIYKGSVEDGVGGGFLGFAKGLGMIVPRTLVGVYEFVSCPIPAPSNFRPILDPEFPWGYFSASGHSEASRSSPSSSSKKKH